MKRLISWSIVVAALMVGLPFAVVSFFKEAGMGVFVLLFFIINPLLSVVCGIFAGRDIKRLWSLPLILAVLFLIGSWLFFEFGEPDFLIYGSVYFVIAALVMLISSFIKQKH